MLKNLLSELIGLAIVIFAAVAWFKQLGAHGRVLTLSGFMFGLVLGLAYRYAMAPMVDFAGWFWAVIFGLMAGFMATGAYKGGQSITGTDQQSLPQPTQPDLPADKP
jgi:di/tricarboxylate transporter